MSSISNIKQLIRGKIYPIRERLHRIKVYLSYILRLRKQNSKRVLIFAQGRTGSTLLESLLCSTGHFVKSGEVLGSTRSEIKYPFQYISGLSNIATSDNFIFHLKIYHLTRDRTEEVEPTTFLNKIHKDGWKIIFLQRKNKLNHVLSNAIAERRSDYHKYDDSKEIFHFHMDPGILQNKIEERLSFERSEIEALAGLDYLNISYEEDLEKSINHQNSVDKILDFLGLERRDCSTGLKKINTSSQKEVIQNYDEIVSLLKEKGWSEYLE